MNRQIVKLFAFIVVLFGVLIGFTSYWSVFDADALKERNANKRPLLEQQQIPRGRILAADGTVIAKSVPKGKGSAKRYVRRYPEGTLFGHPIGYIFVQYGDTEFEQFHNDELVGEGSEFSSIADELLGHTQEGNDVVTNIDTEAQRVALGDLEEQGFGAVVAIEPDSGAVKVMASNAPFDPNRVPDEYSKLANNDIETPLLNRATQGLYPPGSTFKVVTAAAGLDSGVITPETTIEAPGSLEVEGTPLENDFSEDFGAIALDTALTNSVNTWFGQLGQQLGNDTLFE
ncbi:MAG TPA: penicillin-binding transpeptidase domain-containing protein, partial [Solirubrobacterales bacterium]|nr:penicillin-binding transpeptidase domain-containing protein [Solirubrobacterales bacterium]